MTEFSIETKAANRAARRAARSLGRTIGNASRSAQRIDRPGPRYIRFPNAPFDPDAVDADADGIVQEGSRFERSISQAASIASRSRAARAMTSNERALSMVRPRRIPQDRSRADWLRGRSPAEIARLVVPANIEEARAAHIARSVGPASLFPSAIAYEREVARAMRRFERSIADEAEPTNKAYIKTPFEPDFSPEAIATARARVESALRESPAHYEVVQRLGHPTVVMNRKGIPLAQGMTQLDRGSAYYSPSRMMIVINPDWDEVTLARHSNFQSQDGRQGPFLADPSARGTIRHEYGHYIHFMLADQAERTDPRQPLVPRQQHTFIPFTKRFSNPRKMVQAWVISSDPDGLTEWGSGKDGWRKKDLWVRSIYGHDDIYERFAEAYAAVTAPTSSERLGDPMVNDFTTQYFADLLGFETRKVRRSPRAELALALPNQERMPDGRPRIEMLPRRTNVPIDGDKGYRLHHFFEPTRSQIGNGMRSASHQVGDHRWYEARPQLLSLATDAYTEATARIAGANFLEEPHYGAMIRTLSSAHFGFPIYDMPTDGFESRQQLAMHAGIITGEITDLPRELRGQIESAFEDTQSIHRGIQRAPLTKKPLYRRLRTTSPDDVLGSMEIGDEIPLPITAFSDTRDGQTGGVVLRIESGARALDIKDGEHLTQGTFRVESYAKKPGEHEIRLRHIETYDPLHDSMRRIDNDTPYTMRQRGSSLRRYTNDEAQEITQRTALRSSSRPSTTGNAFRSASRIEPEEITQDDLDEMASLLDQLRQGIDDGSAAPPPSLVRSVANEVRKRITDRVKSDNQKIRKMYEDRQDKTPWLTDGALLRDLASDMPRFRAVLSKLRNTGVTIGNFIDVNAIRNYTTTGDFYGMNGEVLFNRNTNMSKFLRDLGYSDEEIQDLDATLNALTAIGRAYRFGEVLNPDAPANKQVKFAENTTFTIGANDSPSAIEIRLNGDLHSTSTDRTVGGVNRTIQINPPHIDDATPYVEIHNHSLNVNPEHKGYGIQETINQHAWLWFASTGNAGVSLGAAMDGPYVWRRLGFEGRAIENRDDKLKIAAVVHEEVINRELPNSVIQSDKEAARLMATVIESIEQDIPLSLIALANVFDTARTPSGDIDRTVTEKRRDFLARLHRIHLPGFEQALTQVTTDSPYPQAALLRDFAELPDLPRTARVTLLQKLAATLGLSTENNKPSDAVIDISQEINKRLAKIRVSIVERGDALKAIASDRLKPWRADAQKTLDFFGEHGPRLWLMADDMLQFINAKLKEDGKSPITKKQLLANLTKHRLEAIRDDKKWRIKVPDASGELEDVEIDLTDSPWHAEGELTPESKAMLDGSIQALSAYNHAYGLSSRQATLPQQRTDVGTLLLYGTDARSDNRRGSTVLSFDENGQPRVVADIRVGKTPEVTSPYATSIDEMGGFRAVISADGVETTIREPMSDPNGGVSRLISVMERHANLWHRASGAETNRTTYEGTRGALASALLGISGKDGTLARLDDRQMFDVKARVIREARGVLEAASAPGGTVPSDYIIRTPEQAMRALAWATDTNGSVTLLANALMRNQMSNEERDALTAFFGDLIPRSTTDIRSPDDAGSSITDIAVDIKDVTPDFLPMSLDDSAERLRDERNLILQETSTDDNGTVIGQVHVLDISNGITKETASRLSETAEIAPARDDAETRASERYKRGATVLAERIGYTELPQLLTMQQAQELLMPQWDDFFGSEVRAYPVTINIGSHRSPNVRLDAEKMEQLTRGEHSLSFEGDSGNMGLITHVSPSAVLDNIVNPDYPEELVDASESTTALALLPKNFNLVAYQSIQLSHSLYQQMVKDGSPELTKRRISAIIRSLGERNDKKLDYDAVQKLQTFHRKALAGALSLFNARATLASQRSVATDPDSIRRLDETIKYLDDANPTMAAMLLGHDGIVSIINFPPIEQRDITNIEEYVQNLASRFVVNTNNSAVANINRRTLAGIGSPLLLDWATGRDESAKPFTSATSDETAEPLIMSNIRINILNRGKISIVDETDSAPKLLRKINQPEEFPALYLPPSDLDIERFQDVPARTKPSFYERDWWKQEGLFSQEIEDIRALDPDGIQEYINRINARRAEKSSKPDIPAPEPLQQADEATAAIASSAVESAIRLNIGEVTPKRTTPPSPGAFRSTSRRSALLAQPPIDMRDDNGIFPQDSIADISDELGSHIRNFFTNQTLDVIDRQPTIVRTPQEAQRLAAIIDRLRETGKVSGTQLSAAIDFRGDDRQFRSVNRIMREHRIPRPIRSESRAGAQEPRSSGDAEGLIYLSSLPDDAQALVPEWKEYLNRKREIDKELAQLTVELWGFPRNDAVLTLWQKQEIAAIRKRKQTLHAQSENIRTYFEIIESYADQAAGEYLEAHGRVDVIDTIIRAASEWEAETGRKVTSRERERLDRYAAEAQSLRQEMDVAKQRIKSLRRAVNDVRAEMGIDANDDDSDISNIELFSIDIVKLPTEAELAQESRNSKLRILFAIWADFPSFAYRLDPPGAPTPRNPTSTNPRRIEGIPSNVHRKLVALMRTALHRATPKTEAESAQRVANRLLRKYRPDLADDPDFLPNLRSASRARKPDVPRLNPRGSNPRAGNPSVVARGFDKSVISRLRPNGGSTKERVLAELKAVFTKRTGNSIIGGSLDRNRRPGRDMDFDGPDSLIHDIPSLFDAFRADGMSVIPVTGDGVAKIQGPIIREFADLFGDEADIENIRAVAYPDADDIVDIVTETAIAHEKASKIVGEDYDEWLAHPYIMMVDPSSGEVVEARHSIREGRALLVLTDGSDAVVEGGFDDPNFVGTVKGANGESRKLHIQHIEWRRSDGSPAASIRNLREGGVLSPIGKHIVQYATTRFGGVVADGTRKFPLIDMNQIATSLRRKDISPFPVYRHERLKNERIDDGKYQKSFAVDVLRHLFGETVLSQYGIRTVPHGAGQDGVRKVDFDSIEIYGDDIVADGVRAMLDVKSSAEEIDRLAAAWATRLKAMMNDAGISFDDEIEKGITVRDAIMLGWKDDSLVTPYSTAQGGRYGHALHLASEMISRGFSPSFGSDDVTHEFSHIVLGQGFTRHGEHAANISFYATRGLPFWWDAYDTTMLQGRQFIPTTLAQGPQPTSNVEVMKRVVANLRVRGANDAAKRLEEEWQDVGDYFKTLPLLHPGLPISADKLGWGERRLGEPNARTLIEPPSRVRRRIATNRLEATGKSDTVKITAGARAKSKMRGPGGGISRFNAYVVDHTDEYTRFGDGVVFVPDENGQLRIAGDLSRTNKPSALDSSDTIEGSSMLRSALQDVLDELNEQLEERPDDIQRRINLFKKILDWNQPDLPDGSRMGKQPVIVRVFRTPDGSQVTGAALYRRTAQGNISIDYVASIGKGHNVAGQALRAALVEASGLHPEHLGVSVSEEYDLGVAPRRVFKPVRIELESLEGATEMWRRYGFRSERIYERGSSFMYLTESDVIRLLDGERVEASRFRAWGDRVKADENPSPETGLREALSSPED